MGTQTIELLFSQKGMTRQSIRKKMVDKFLLEKPGPAEDETYNRYIYVVEKVKEGDIILVRPANLKLGFDFRIDVTDIKFSKGTNAPSHYDIFMDLKKKHEINKIFAEEVRLGILRIINMEDPIDVLKDIKEEDLGLSVELLLKISKWFAVEMDIRYWNGWGRNKYRVWLELMKLFNYQFIAISTGYNFQDENGEVITENKALKSLEEEGK